MRPLRHAVGKLDKPWREAREPQQHPVAFLRQTLTSAWIEQPEQDGDVSFGRGILTGALARLYGGGPMSRR